MIYRYRAVDDTIQKLKIEINLEERLSFLGQDHKNFRVNSSWFQGESIITTFALEELISTKLRALYQRKKGRDLIDLWYVLEHQPLNIPVVIDVFGKYMSAQNLHITRNDFLDNLEEKKQDPNFRADIEALLPPQKHIDFHQAYEKVLQEIILHLPIR